MEDRHIHFTGGSRYASAGSKYVPAGSKYRLSELKKATACRRINEGKRLGTPLGAGSTCVVLKHEVLTRHRLELSPIEGQ
jgi:hypothetical protein